MKKIWQRKLSQNIGSKELVKTDGVREALRYGGLNIQRSEKHALWMEWLVQYVRDWGSIMPLG